MLHLTHLLQSFDVSVFNLLKENYKKLLSEKTRFLTYNIDKTDFILLIQKARQHGITFRNIQLAWRAIRLLPYNPAIVFQKLSVNRNDTSASNNNKLELVQIRLYKRGFIRGQYHQHLGI